jgi:uncharacterized membrane protein YphA (DoxX/SURF4 family)
MFLFTAVSHFAAMRKDFIAMVPPALPHPELLVSLTGIAELAGAVGLLIPSLRLWAACGLILLMVLMLPANVSAARRGVLLRGRRDVAADPSANAGAPYWLGMDGSVIELGTQLHTHDRADMRTSNGE